MELQDRFMRIMHHPQQQALIATDVKGRLHKLDLQLNPLQSSPSTSQSHPINAITADERYIYTKNRVGAITKWDAATLRPLNAFDPVHLCDESDLLEGEEPWPANNRGIAVLNGRIYSNNGYSQFVVLDAETMEIVEIRGQITENSLIDSVCADSADIQALSEINGLVHIGNLETHEFPITLRADDGGIHWVRYDKRHDRFVCTQDDGLGADRYIRNGLATFERDGSNLKTYPFTADDVEFLEFDDTYEKIYVGGFDAHIYIYDNTRRDLRLKSRIGPFNYQLLNLVYVSDDQLYVLMQTGEVVCCNSKGEILHSMKYRNQCVWEMEPHPNDESLVYAATDDGVRILRYGAGAHKSIDVEVVAFHPHNFGVTTRVKPLADGGYLAISRRNVVFRADRDGLLVWHKSTQGTPRGLAVDPERGRVLVGSEESIAVELDLETGRERKRFSYELGPVYATGYAPDGRRIVVLRHTDVFVYSADEAWDVLYRGTPLDHYPKRVVFQAGKCFFTGTDGVTEFDLDTYEVKNNWTEFLINTKESAILLDGHIHVVTYGYQLASYRYDDGEIVSLIEGLPDFTKSIIGRTDEAGNHLMLVGGRGGFVSAYLVQDGIPRKSRDVYL